MLNNTKFEQISLTLINFGRVIMSEFRELSHFFYLRLLGPYQQGWGNSFTNSLKSGPVSNHSTKMIKRLRKEIARGWGRGESHEKRTKWRVIMGEIASAPNGGLGIASTVPGILVLWAVMALVTPKWRDCTPEKKLRGGNEEVKDNESSRMWWRAKLPRHSGCFIS